jgi:hypothetical protein
MNPLPLTRREFAQAAAAGTVSATLGAAPATAATQPEPTSDAQALYEMIRLRYGQHLDAEQLKRIRASIEGHIRRADRLRKFPVGQDDPVFVFHAEVP